MRIAAFDDRAPAGTASWSTTGSARCPPAPTCSRCWRTAPDQDWVLAGLATPCRCRRSDCSRRCQPAAVRDFVTFEEHVEGVRRSVDGAAGVPEQWYAAPTFYFTNPYSIIGPADDVPVPPGCRAFDFELEVAAVIGRPGRDLTPEQARDHIVGYTIFNDWSARDLQSAEMRVGLGPAKGKDTSTTFGPWLVTADELEPYRDCGRLPRPGTHRGGQR